MIRFALILVAMLQIAAAQAQEQARPFAAPAAAPSAAPPGISSLGDVTLALAIVLAAIFAAAWLLRRVRGLGKPAGSALNVIAQIPLGPKESAVLLRVGKTQLLVGVAPGRVSALHVLAEPVDTNPPPVSADSLERPNFKTLLMRSLGKS